MCESQGKRNTDTGKHSIFFFFLIPTWNKETVLKIVALILKLLIYAALISRRLGTNSELSWNNWIHLRFTEDSMLAYFYICMEIKRWNLVVVNSLSRNRLRFSSFFFFLFKVSRKVCFFDLASERKRNLKGLWVERLKNGLSLFIIKITQHNLLFATLPPPPQIYVCQLPSLHQSPSPASANQYALPAQQQWRPPNKHFGQWCLLPGCRDGYKSLTHLFPRKPRSCVASKKCHTVDHINYWRQQQDSLISSNKSQRQEKDAVTAVCGPIACDSHLIVRTRQYDTL